MNAPVAQFSRRALLTTSGAAAVGSFMAPAALADVAANVAEGKKEVRYSFNTSTIRGQKLPLMQLIEIAGKAGYHAIEPWMNEIRAHVDAGGTVSDLRKRIADAGMTMESAIGFAEWVVDDDAKRAKGLENAAKDMELVREMGGKRIAAPPVGATNQTDLNLTKAAERYRALLELGEKLDVIPQVEVWGFSKSLCRLSEVAYVAVETGHKNACILADVYHIFKGGSQYDSLRLFSGSALQVFHMNDIPANFTRDVIKDADRVFPGDGIAPLPTMLRDLFASGFRGHLSLELFNPEYYKRDAFEVAKTGLEKMKEVVAKVV